MKQVLLKILSLMIGVFLSMNSSGQALSEDQLIQKNLFVTKSAALNEKNDVYRLRLYDYSRTDYAILSLFPKLQVLSFVESSKVDVIPLGFKKLLNLTHLDISETQIRIVSLYIKKNKNLKYIYCRRGQLDEIEKNTLAKRGITVWEEDKSKYLIFVKVNDSGLDVVKPHETTNFNANVSNGHSTGISKSMLHKNTEGQWAYNPDKVTIEDKNVWYVNVNGKEVMYKKALQGGLFNKQGDLIAFLPLMMSVPAHFKFQEGLIPYKDLNSEKLGYIDTMGRIVIQAQYDKVNSFTGGKAIVEVDGRKSYIDKTGRTIYTGEFKELVPFYYPKYAVIQIEKDTLFSIIDEQGQIIARNKFLKSDFEELGKIALKETFESNRVKTRDKSHWGFKTLRGDWVIKPIYFSVSRFVSGVATVCLNKNDVVGDDGFIKSQAMGLDNTYGLIDVNGKFILPLEFERMSDPWHNHFEDEVSISAYKKEVGYTIFDPNGKPLFGPIQNYKGKSILRLEPYKNDHFLVEYQSSKKITTRHFSDFNQSVCDVVHKSGKVVISENEFICQSVDNNGFVVYTNFNDCVPITFGELGNAVENRISGVVHINGKTLFHQTNGALDKKNGKFDCWRFRENPKDSNSEKDASMFYVNLVLNGKKSVRNGVSLLDQDKVATYDSLGNEVKNVLDRETFKIFSKTNGSPETGEDVFRLNHFDKDGKFAGTALYSISLDKFIYIDNTKTTIGNFAQNRFFVPNIGYIVERVK